LLFLKPYSRYSSHARTMEDVKSELYSEVRRGDVPFNKKMLIEYYTEYGQEKKPPSFSQSQ
jgi:hypothetical protein